jgi:hypothetical protein
VNTAELVSVVGILAGAIVGAVWAVVAVLGSRIDEHGRRLERAEDAAARRHEEITAALAQIRTDLAVIRTELTEHGRRLERVEP